MLTASLLWLIARYGENVPAVDEWDITPQMRQAVHDGELAGWAAGRHNEHFFPAGRLVYAAVMWASGYDFRSGMVASVLFLAIAAGLFADAARRLRGRPALFDTLFPALLLNWSAAGNVLMGYQVVYTLAVLAAAFAAWVVAARIPGRRGDVAASAALVLLALNGVVGLLLAAPYLGWALHRSKAGHAITAWRSLAVYLPAAAVAAYGLIAVSAGGSATDAPSARHLSQFVGASGQFLTLGLGTWVNPFNWHYAAAIVVTLYGMAGFTLARSHKTRPGERAVAWGLAALLAGVVGMAFGVAWGRGGALVDRYASLSAIGLAVCGLVAARHLAGRAADALGLAAAVALIAVNVTPGERFAQVQCMYSRELADAVRAGLPPSYIADRFRGPVFEPPRFAARLEALRDLGFPKFRGLVAEPRTAAVPCGRPDPTGDPLPVPDGSPELFGVVIEYETERAVEWQKLRLVWVDPAGVGHESAVYAPPGRGRRTARFPVGGPVAAARLAADAPAAGVTVVAVGWVRINE